MLSLTILLLLTSAPLAAQETPSTEKVQSPQPHAIGRFLLHAEPGGFDPVFSSQVVDSIVQRQILECLTEYDYAAGSEKIQGLLASTWTVSDDGLTWVFTLRKGASFYDPFDPPLWASRRRPVEAKDILYSWLRMADARNPSLGYWAMEGVFVGLDDFRERTAALDPKAAEAAFQKALDSGLKGIQVVDKNHLQIRLLQEDSHFMQRLAMTHFAVYPQEAVVATKRSMLDEPVGSGPFVVQDWIPEQSLILQKTPQWRGQASPFGDGSLPFLDQVEFHTVRDARTAIKLFDRGEIDRLPLGNTGIHYYLDATQRLQSTFQDRGIVLHNYSLPDITMLCFGMDDPILGIHRGDTLGNAKRRLLRKALALSFPYRLWGERIRGSLPAQPARNFLPPIISGSQNLAPSTWNHRDLAAARKLLQEAGYTEGQGLPPLEFQVPGTSAISRAIGDLYVAAAAEIGLKMKAVLLPYREQLERARHGQAQIFLRAWVLDWADAALILQTFYGPFAGTETNLCSFRNPPYDTLFQQFRTLEEGPQRQALAADLLSILNQEIPAIPIDHRRGWLLTQPWLSDFQIHPFDILPTKYYRILPH